LKLQWENNLTLEGHFSIMIFADYACHELERFLKDRFDRISSLLSSGYQGLFSEGKVAGA
jgi:hypothetical protein